MRGTVRRNGKTWQYIFDIEPDPAGSRRQMTRSGFRTKAEAQKALRQAIGDHEREAPHSAESVDDSPFAATPLATFLTETWLPRKGLDELAPSTLASYEGLIRCHIASDAIGQKPLRDLTEADFEDLYARMAAKPGRRVGSSLSQKTTRHLHRVLVPALDYAVKKGLIPSNPIDEDDAPRLAKTRTLFRVWSPADARKFLSWVRNSDNSRMWPLYVLALTTGARRGELLGLTWECVNLDAPSVRFERSRTSVRYEVGSGKVKTPQSARTIRLPEGKAGRAALEGAKRQQERDWVLFGATWEDSGYVFTKPTGEPLHPDYVSQRFSRDVRRAGVPRIRFHDLRHTFATTALTENQHPKVVSEVLGHSTTDLTLSTYSHVLPGIHEAAVAAVDLALFGGSLDTDVTNPVTNDGPDGVPAGSERAESPGVPRDSEGSGGRI